MRAAGVPAGVYISKDACGTRKEQALKTVYDSDAYINTSRALGGECLPHTRSLPWPDIDAHNLSIQLRQNTLA